MVQSITAFASKTYVVGSHALSSTPIPIGVTQATLYFDRTAWLDPLALIAVSLDLSLDGGATWNFFAGFTAQGGVHFDPNGQLETKAGIFISGILQPLNANRRVRATLAVSGKSFKTSAILVLL